MMEALVTVAVFGGAVAVSRARLVGDLPRAQHRAWTDVRPQGAWLEDVAIASSHRRGETRSGTSTVLSGRAGGHNVRIEAYSHTKYDKGVRVVLEGDSGITLRLERRRTSAPSEFRRPAGS